LKKLSILLSAYVEHDSRVLRTIDALSGKFRILLFSKDESFKHVEHKVLHRRYTSADKVFFESDSISIVKLMKKFCDLTFDENNACVLPEESNKILINLILQMQSLDVMKVAIMKLYNPLAGRDVFGRGTGCR